MSIWFKENNEHLLRNMLVGNLLEHLGIDQIELGDDFVRGRMPVDKRTHQPTGILHGGASVVLAESLGSIGSNLVVDPDKFYCVGLNISANHIRPVEGGYVYAKATPVHLGRKSHVWTIEITNQEGKIVCVSRLTMAVIQKENS